MVDTNLVSAGLRHIRDAEALLATSPDQAWHLAGFGPECIRKATVTSEWARLAIGHALSGRGLNELLELIAALDPLARRHGLRAAPVPAPPISQWRPVHRYEPTGRRLHAAALALAEACRREVDRRVAELFAAGVLPAEVP